MKPSADEYTVDLQPCAEADLELFRNSWSAGFLGERLYTAADWADAVSACTKLAALCTTAAPKIGVVRKLHYCANCTNTCAFAYDLSRLLMDRPVHELKRWNIFLARCGLRLKELIPGSQHRARDGTLTT